MPGERGAFDARGKFLDALQCLELAESEALLDALWAHALKAEFQWRHRWRVGDLVVWDNRSTMHHRQAFDPAARRILHKTQTVGDRPSFSPASLGLGPHARAAMQ